MMKLPPDDAILHDKTHNKQKAGLHELTHTQEIPEVRHQLRSREDLALYIGSSRNEATQNSREKRLYELVARLSWQRNLGNEKKQTNIASKVSN